MKKIGLRFVSAVILSLLLGLVFWGKPDMTPEMFGVTTPQQTMMFMAGVFLVFWVYLFIQGFPISHGDIGSASTHNLDNIVSGFPGIVALFGVFLSLTGMKPLSWLNILLAVMTLAVVWLDMYIFGGAAAKINRLTDEFKSER